ncbi:hypothetical protein KI387_034005, partial [Taxus chinensis]
MRSNPVRINPLEEHRYSAPITSTSHVSIDSLVTLFQYLTDFRTSNRRRLSVHHFPIPESSCTVPDRLIYFQSMPILYSRRRSFINRCRSHQSSRSSCRQVKGH